MKHTPGPWRICEVIPGNTWIVDNYRAAVATITHKWDRTEETPNAHLIAAAPDLLDACGVALVALDFAALHLGQEKTIELAQNFIKNAIAQATDESSEKA